MPRHADPAFLNRLGGRPEDRLPRVQAMDLVGAALDDAQVFTTPDCKVHRAKDGHVSVQVWVTLPPTE
jgi:hypothetical protein